MVEENFVVLLKTRVAKVGKRMWRRRRIFLYLGFALKISKLAKLGDRSFLVNKSP